MSCYSPLASLSHAEEKDSSEGTQSSHIDGAVTTVSWSLEQIQEIATTAAQQVLAEERKQQEQVMQEKEEAKQKEDAEKLHQQTTQMESVSTSLNKVTQQCQDVHSHVQLLQTSLNQFISTHTHQPTNTTTASSPSPSLSDVNLVTSSQFNDQLHTWSEKQTQLQQSLSAITDRLDNQVPAQIETSITTYLQRSKSTVVSKEDMNSLHQKQEEALLAKVENKMQALMDTREKKLFHAHFDTMEERLAKVTGLSHTLLDVTKKHDVLIEQLSTHVQETQQTRDKEWNSKLTEVSKEAAIRVNQVTAQLKDYVLTKVSAKAQFTNQTNKQAKKTKPKDTISIHLHSSSTDFFRSIYILFIDAWCLFFSVDRF